MLYCLSSKHFIHIVVNILYTVCHQYWLSINQYDWLSSIDSNYGEVVVACTELNSTLKYECVGSIPILQISRRK